MTDRSLSTQSKEEVGPFAQPLGRRSILVALVGDAVLLAASGLLSAGLNWLYIRLVPPDQVGWALKVVFWITDFGFVGAMAIFTLFDLIRFGVRAWKSLAREIAS